MAATPAWVDPVAYAHAATNNQYRAILAQLNQNMAQLRGQGKQNLADIGAWYGQAQQAQQQGAQFDNAAAQSAQQGYGNALGALSGILGGNSEGAAQFARSAAAGDQQLQGLQQNQAGFNAQMGANLAHDSATARTNQQNSESSAMQGLKSQLATQLANKGSSYITNLSAAQQQKLQMEAEMQNMSLAGKQFNLDKMLAGGKMTNQNLINQGLQQQINKDAKNPAGGFVQWDHVASGDRGHVERAVSDVMYGAGGKAMTDPKKAWVFAANELRRTDPKWDVKSDGHVRHWLSSLWMQYVNDYNTLHPHHQYSAMGNHTPWSDTAWGGGKQKPAPGKHPHDGGA